MISEQYVTCSPRKRMESHIDPRGPSDHCCLTLSAERPTLVVSPQDSRGQHPLLPTQPPAPGPQGRKTMETNDEIQDVPGKLLSTQAPRGAPQQGNFWGSTSRQSREHLTEVSGPQQGLRISKMILRPPTESLKSGDCCLMEVRPPTP